MTQTSGEFFQAGPELHNQYETDEALKSYLRRKLPAGVLAEVEPDLRRMGGHQQWRAPATSNT